MRVSKSERKKNAKYFYSRLTSGFKDHVAIVIKSNSSITNPNIQRTQFLTNVRDGLSRPIVIAESLQDGIVGCFNELIEFIGDGIKQEKHFHQDGFNNWLNNHFDIRIVYNDGLVILLEYYHDMKHIITRKMLERGYKQGIIKLTTEEEYAGLANSDDEFEGVICQIGEFWFWFGGEKAEEMTVEEYKRNIPKDTIIDEIFEVLDSDFKTEFEDEYLYYYYYLMENLKQEN